MLQFSLFFIAKNKLEVQVEIRIKESLLKIAESRLFRKNKTVIS